MYKKFFGLRENPFNVNPDPHFLFLTQATQEAWSCLTYGIQCRRGFILLTGEVGTGKTTLLNKLLSWLHKQRIANSFIFNPGLEPSQFVDYMLADFGLNCETRQKSQMLQRLNKWLLERYRLGGTAVLIVDEAQNLTPEVLEEIRLLTNLETSTEKLLQIVLSGQPELEAKLNRPELRQLRQRITLRCKTQPLTLEETHQYVNSRMRTAGANGQPVFSLEALNAVHEYSRGIPRVVNLLCEHGLIGAYAQQQRPVSLATIQEAAHEFQLDVTPPTAGGASGKEDESRRLIEAFQTLATLMDKLRPPR
jgi:general secretion pathway protein A